MRLGSSAVRPRAIHAARSSASVRVRANVAATRARTHARSPMEGRMRVRSVSCPAVPLARLQPSRALLALILYAALFAASLYPQSMRPGAAIGYVGDSLESVYIVAWNVHQFF